MDKDDIKLEDLPEEVKQIAEVIGLDACISLVRMYGGEQIYIPKFDTITRKSRDRSIYAMRLKSSYRELAREHNLTENAVREIIKRERREQTNEPRQLSLF